MGLEPEQLREALAKLPVISGVATDRHSIPADRLLILVIAARELLALKEAPTHADYDVALPEIEEWVNRKGAW